MYTMIRAMICLVCGEVGPRRDACIFCGSSDTLNCRVPG